MPKSAQNYLTELQKLAQKLRNRLPKPLRRRLFTKPADLHKTCTGMARLHVHPPWRALFSYLLHQKVIQKPVLKVCKQHKKTNEKVPKRVPKRCPGTSRMAPRGIKNHSKISLGSTRRARRYPRALKGPPRSKKRSKRHPKTLKKRQNQ